MNKEENDWDHKAEANVVAGHIEKNYPGKNGNSNTSNETRKGS